jgi:long-chain fatty acid transport protein
MRRIAVLSAVAFVAVVGATTTSAHAQGFGVYEHDACMMARAGTGVASPCGASAVFYNPAGIVGGSHRWNVQAGLTMIAPRGAFTDSASRVTTQATPNNIPVPAFFVTRQLTARWAVGLGVNAPYGLISEWPNTFAGRFLAYRAELKAVYVSPTVAFSISPRVQVGAGVDYVHTTVNVRQRVDVSSQVAVGTTTFAQLGIPVGTDFADAVLDGSGNHLGAHFGFLAKPWDWVSVGARLLTRVTVNVEGTGNFTRFPTGITLPAGNPFGAPGGTPLDTVVTSAFAGKLYSGQGVSTRIPLPEQIIVGVALRPISGATLLVDYQYVNWRAFQILPFDLDSAGTRTLHEDYRPTSGWRGGIELTPTDKVTIRGGMLWHQAAAPAQTVTPLLPEGMRIEGTAGLGLQLSPRMRLDVAYQYIRQQDRRGRVVDAAEGSVPTVALNSGLYTSTAKLYGASLAFAF